MISEGTADNFADLVLLSERPVVVDFWAPWCGPCKVMGPILEEIGNDPASEYDIVKVNVDDYPALGADYGVTSIPNMMVFVDGMREDSVVGALPKVKLKQAFDEIING